MPKMVSIDGEREYEGRRHVVGEEFEVEEKDLRRDVDKLLHELSEKGLLVANA